MITAWANNYTSAGSCASIRSAVGFQITFGEYPVMFNGHYEIMPFQTIDNLSPNTTYYIYIARHTSGALHYKFSRSKLPETLVNIYIGWIHTDNIGISSSDLVKYININNMQINESKDTMVAPTLTLDRILAGGNKSLITKEYVDNAVFGLPVGAVSFFDTIRGVYTISASGTPDYSFDDQGETINIYEFNTHETTFTVTDYEYLATPGQDIILTFSAGIGYFMDCDSPVYKKISPYQYDATLEVDGFMVKQVGDSYGLNNSGWNSYAATKYTAKILTTGNDIVLRIAHVFRVNIDHLDYDANDTLNVDHGFATISFNASKE